MLVFIVSPSAVPAPEGSGERERDVPEEDRGEKRRLQGAWEGGCSWPRGTQVVLLLWSVCRAPYACMECPCASPYAAAGEGSLLHTDS